MTLIPCIILLCTIYIAGWAIARPAHSSPSILWAGCYGENVVSLWKRPYHPLGAPIKIYGNIDFYETDWTALSPDETRLRLSYYIYDLRKPGIRQYLPANDFTRDRYLAEWTPDGKGVLLAAVAKQDQQLHGGLYSAGLDGKYSLIAKPFQEELDAVCTAKYSPDGKMLVLEAYSWLQVIDAHTGRSLLFSYIWDIMDTSEIEDGSIGENYLYASSRVWLDGHRLLMPRNNALLLLDTRKMSVRPVVKKLYINSLAYAPDAKGLYASQEKNTEEYLCSIDIDTGTYKRIDLPGLSDVHVFDITSDGKELLVAAWGDKERPDSYDRRLYLVNLATKRHTLVAKRAFYAAFIR